MNDDIFASLAQDPNNRLTPFSDTKQGMVEDWLPTLMPEVDSVLMGGLPLSGRVTEVFGSPNVGKSTFVMNMIAIAQKLGMVPVYFDVEGTTNAERLRDLGVNVDRILTKIPRKDKSSGIVTPLTIEEIFQTMISLAAQIHAKNPKVSTLFIWDTVAMTQPEAVADAEVGTQRVGTQAKALTEGVRKLNANLVENNASLIALNQVRDDIGGNPMFPTVKTAGGNAWQHEMSLRLHLDRGKKETVSASDKTEIGHMVKIKFIKSKIGDNAGAVANAVMLQKTGFDTAYNLFLEAENEKLITGTQYKNYTTDSGEEVKKRKKDFIAYLDTDEGKPLFIELWQKLIIMNFPECYPPLFNVTAIMDEEQFPEIKGMREYYIKKQEELDEANRHTQYRLWKDANPEAVAKVVSSTEKATKKKSKEE